MSGPLRVIWDAPPARPAPPRRVWRDWALLGAVVVAAVVEAFLRTELEWRLAGAVILVALAPTLLWRRTHPLAMLLIGQVVAAVFTVATGASTQLFTVAYFLVLVYSLPRWGSGRAIVAGVAALIGSTLLSVATGAMSATDLVGGLAVITAVVSAGLAVRAVTGARARELDRARILERERLARELHDTIAHRMSAIAVQAQAGIAVAGAEDSPAVATLHVIEDEASRTLAEMRGIVGALRRADAPGDPAPQITASLGDDLRALARAGARVGEPSAASTAPATPEILVHLDGDVDALPAELAAATHRIAQESVTNAVRHARHATRIDVHVTVTDAAVVIAVHDDGEHVASARPGFGITGMRERALLSGGTCEAGPAPGGGWLVSADLPRDGGGS